MQSRTRIRGGFVVGWLTIGLVGISMNDAAPPNPELQAAKQAFLREMKKPAPAARVAAVAALSRVKQPGAADFLLKRGFVDEEPSVRLAVRHALRQMVDDPIVSRYLIDELKKSLRKPAAIEITAELFRALAVTEDESHQNDVVKYLDDFLNSPKANLLVPMSVIDDDGQQGDEYAIRSVKLMARAKAFESHFGYRRCVVQAMTQIRRPEAVDYLIEFFPSTQGLIQHDVIRYLTSLTRQKFRDDARNWAKWWKENRAEFQFPAAGVALPDVEFDEQEQTYYGIPICAKRIVFVLDTSGSMRGQPIEAAKQALLNVVQSLPESVSFDIVMFDVQATAWHPRLVSATADAKREAAYAVRGRGLGNATVSSAALNTAFGLEPEAIYFLSDGEPTDGAPSQIVSACSLFNQTRRISIHTIGVVTTANGGAGLTNFMKPLAEQNYGKFRLIE